MSYRHVSYSSATLELFAFNAMYLRSTYRTRLSTQTSFLLPYSWPQQSQCGSTKKRHTGIMHRYQYRVKSFGNVQ